MRHIPYTLIVLAAAAGFASAQSTSYTTPVGYVTHTIAGALGGTPSETLVASTLVNGDELAAVSTNNPSGTDTISISSTVPGTVDSACYVEITDGANEGWWSTVESVSGSSITTVDNFPTGLAVGTNFAVRKHQTILGLLGYNAPGLDTGSDLDSADEVQVLDPSTQVVSQYFFATEADGGPAPSGGWFDGAGNPADSVVIVPGSSILVKRKVSGDVAFTSSGTVKTTATQVDIFTGDNWVTPMRAGNVTLGDSNLDTGIITTGLERGLDLSVDEVQFIPLSQIVASYFAATPSEEEGISGFYDGGGSPSNSVVVDASSGIRIKRKNASGAIWTAPAQPIATP